MADVLKNEEVSDAVKDVYRGIEFFFERIGSCCNAGRPRPFSKAECSVQPIVKRQIEETCIGFQSVFETGFKVIWGLKLGKTKYQELKSHFKEAFEILDKFMKNKSIHEKSIDALLNNGSNLTETVVTTALAEHLLSKLAPGQSYTVDKKYRDNADVCKCGCKAKINFGDTGIGHEKVWHGFVDIMFSSHDGIEPETVAVMQDIPEPDSDTEQESDTESVTKKFKQDPNQKESEPCSDKEEDPPDKNSDVKNDLSGEKSNSDQKNTSPDEKFPAEVKVDMVDNEDKDDQTIAKAIVFSLLQKQRHPEFDSFLIPTIVISSTKLKIVMYDAENDILLRTKSIDLLKQGSITNSCIIILWMVLHYKIFSTDLKKIALTMALDKLKSGFTDKIPPECIEIYKSKLKSCAASFPKVIIKSHNYNSGTKTFIDKPPSLDWP